MANYGIKITRDGFNITSTEPRDYVFSSAFTTVKIALQGSGSINVPASSSATATIAHGLSFTPMALFFSELSPGSGKWFLGWAKLVPFSVPHTPDPDAGDVYIDASTDANYNPIGSYTDNTNLKIKFENCHTTESRTISYYYFIFGDSGT
jgi:hypothetical protein